MHKIKINVNNGRKELGLDVLELLSLAVSGGFMRRSTKSRQQHSRVHKKSAACPKRVSILLVNIILLTISKFFSAQFKIKIRIGQENLKTPYFLE